MTKLENVIIKPLIADGTIKFYGSSADDTLLVMNLGKASQVHNTLHKFDKNLRYTADMLKNEVPHFLDLELSPDRFTIFRKDTNTGSFVNFTSFVPWTYHTSWIRNLVTRASHIYWSDKLPSEINTIKRFVSWNDFPKSVVNKTRNISFITEDSHYENKAGNEVTIYFCVLHYGDKGFSLIKSYIHKIKSNCKKERSTNFRVLNDDTKIDFFYSIKDTMPTSILCCV